MSDRHHVILRARERYPRPAERHVIARARERYGIELSRGDVKAMASMIAGGKSVLMGRIGSNPRPAERHLVTTRHGSLEVVYDARLKRVVTVYRSGSRPDPKARKTRRWEQREQREEKVR